MSKASDRPERDAGRTLWRALVPVAQIPDTGLHRELEADQTTRSAMAEAAGVREVISARASFDLARRSGGRVHVAGRLQARVGQTCVVTLDPIENDIDEEIDLIFAPSEQIPKLAEPADDDADEVVQVADQPEPFENGIIDIGRLATDMLYLAIDPYPRKEGATFELKIADADPEDHPFAALRTLRTESDGPAVDKPKRK
jgi:Large ribosomal RNA subunit accumulation protein YceD